MMQGIQPDTPVWQDIAVRGAAELTGIFHGHKVRLGKEKRFHLADLKAARIPYSGFSKAAIIARGKAMLEGADKGSGD